MDTKNDNTKDMTSDKKDTALALSSDKHFRYISQKVEKIATALHLITNFFPEQEPLRVSIRQKSLTLLSDILSVKNSYVSNTTGSVSFNLSTTLKELVSLLRVALNSGYVSDMNFEILNRELQSLDSLIGSGVSLSPSPQLADAFFDIGAVPERGELKSVPAGMLSQVQRQSPQPSNRAGTSTEESPKESNNSTSRSSAKQKRRTMILSLFNDTDEITIGDVKKVIRGYSAKTIQRDLSRLVGEGVLEKRGKRRWTSYRLVDA